MRDLGEMNPLGATHLVGRHKCRPYDAGWGGNHHADHPIGFRRGDIYGAQFAGAQSNAQPNDVRPILRSHD